MKKKQKKAKFSVKYWEMIENYWKIDFFFSKNWLTSKKTEKFNKKHIFSSTEVLGCFYTQIYSNLLPQLDELHKTDHWNRENASRSEICRLDALLKMAANSDPSGELVRTAFRSIDEEQVIKMLGELGIHSTSDHAFQDYQILAENWQKIEEKGFGYGDY